MRTIDDENHALLVHDDFDARRTAQLWPLILQIARAELIRLWRQLR